MKVALLYNAYTAYTVYIVDTLFTVYTIQPAFNCFAKTVACMPPIYC